MRTVTRNQRKLKYSLLAGMEDVFARDSLGNIKHVTVDGEDVPVKTGEKTAVYFEPVEFRAPLSMSGGEAEAMEYGVSMSDYSATILYLKGTLPITETSIIWADSEVGWLDEDHTRPDAKTADYTVVKISDTLNYSKAILKKVVK